MASKKYKLFLGLVTLMATTTFAQTGSGTGSGYSVFDSTVVPSKRLPQQNEFWNNTYNFPAKPRNQWEVGATIGSIAIGGDVDAQIPQLGFGVHVRKAVGYLFSLRLEYINGSAKGLNWNPANNFAKNPAWIAGNQGFYTSGNLPNNIGYNPVIRDNSGNVRPMNPNAPLSNVFYNYKTNIQDLSIQGIFNLNNIRFHKQKTGFSIYAGAGLGLTVFNAKINALDANGNTYANQFNAIVAANTFKYENRGDILRQIKNVLDNTYETEAESEAGGRRASFGDNNTLKPSATILAGISFKLGKRINLALEDRHTLIKTDLLDGQRWQEHANGDAVLTGDYDSYNYLSLGINFNLGSKSVEPLWWLNPLDYAYGELNNPKHMKLPKPILDDTDGDGVTDQLDREPNTPAGAPVDSHGVSKDTDGDGVPDFKDKQLITPTECQPVDADGVGKCPDPACCTDLAKKIEEGGFGTNGGNNNCPTDYPSLSVKSASLSKEAKALLAAVAAKLKDNPNCNITITAYPGSTKAQQNLADKKLEFVKNYLVEKLGISADRISTDKQIEGGDANTIDIK